eukprot:CAMPEP_0117085790 /NCGR_PEP_ID=MMETSP0472-20121206/60273_1 /TAXON_ID=693140 ORGANISM="Tiarina fusus, Strain LIS" /NCGR_SAMPLE_ID=MMETSP0472 /ASSEMBLY_ACC=CAM_ASM_000603 /LENGTH=2751 /DNA_ID=CAMNT_0004815117 /DNA_START=1687 /DNA_END=9942 /DNA_ORIENTATION=+
METGLISTTLDSLIQPTCPYDTALGAICNVLSAICLTKDGIKEVQSKDVIGIIISVLGKEELAPILKPRVCTMLGSGLNELVKHHPELKEDTLKICLKVIQEVQATKNYKPGGYSAIKRNISTFLECFFAGGFDFGLESTVTQEWIDVLLDMYSNSFGNHSNHGPSRSHSCVIALLGISNNHLGLILRRVFEMIGSQIEILTESTFGYDEETSKILCKLDNLISLLVRLAKPTDYQQQSSLQELGTLQSLMVFQAMGEIHRVLLWELSKLELDAMGKVEGLPRDRRRSRIGSSDLAPRSPLMRMRERYHARLRNAELDRAQEGDGEMEPGIFDPSFRVDRPSLFVRSEALPNPPQAPHAVSRTKNTIREKLLDLTDFINQLSLSLLGAAGFLGDPAPLIKALAQILKGHFTWLSTKKEVETKEKGARFIPVLYLGGMIRGLNSLLTCDIEASCALLLRSFQEENGIVEVVKQCNIHLLNPKVVKTLNSATNQWGTNQQVHSVYPQLTQLLKHIISPRIKQQTLELSSSSFEPKKYLENLYCIVLRVFLPLWKQKSLEELPHDFISDLFSICATFLQGPETFMKDLAPKAPVVADPNLVQQLQGMGFPQRVCEDVLRRVENDIEVALDRLLSGFVMEEAAANLIVESQPEEIPEEFDEEDELAMALAMSMGQPPKESEKKEESEEKVENSTEAITSLLEKLNENLLEDCMRLLHVPEISTPLSQFFVKYAQNDKEKSCSVISLLCQALTSKPPVDPEEHRYNVIFAMTLLGLKKIHFRNAITKNDAVEQFLLFIEETLNQNTEGDSFTAPKWLVTALLAIGSQCQLPAEYEEPPADSNEDPVALCALRTEHQDRAMKACVTLLKHQMEPDITHALLQLISYLTKDQQQAEFFVSSKGINLLFNLQQKTYFGAMATIVGHILRHSAEDVPTLQSTMEHEISVFLKHLIPENEATISPKAFVATFSHLIQREPSVFLSAAANMCQIATYSKDALKVTRLTAPSSVDQESKEDVTPRKAKSKKSQIFITRSKISRKISDGLSMIIPMIAQALIDLVDQQKSIEENEDTAPALKIANFVSFLREFTETYSPCASFIMKKPNFVEKLSVSNFVKFLLEKVLPDSSILSDEKPGNSEQTHQVSGLFIALWTKPDCRRRLLGEISFALTNMLTLAKEQDSPESLGVALNELSMLVGLADLLHALLSATLAPGSEQSCRTELPEMILESGVISQLVHSLDIVDLDRKEASKVLFHLLPALESTLKLVTVFSGLTKNSGGVEPLKDSAQIIRNFGSNDAYERPSLIPWEQVQGNDAMDDEDSQSGTGSSESEEEEEEEEELDIGDDPPFELDSNPFLQGLMERDLSEIEHVLPFLNQHRGDNPNIRVFAGDSFGSRFRPYSGVESPFPARYREESVSVEHPLLAPAGRGPEGSHRSRMLESIFNNPEYSFRNGGPNNGAASATQRLRSLGITLPSSLMMRVNRWLDSGPLSSACIVHAISFEEQLIELLLSDQARAEREKPAVEPVGPTIEEEEVVAPSRERSASVENENVVIFPSGVSQDDVEDAVDPPAPPAPVFPSGLDLDPPAQLMDFLSALSPPNAGNASEVNSAPASDAAPGEPVRDLSSEAQLMSFLSSAGNLFNVQPSNPEPNTEVVEPAIEIADEPVQPAEPPVIEDGEKEEKLEEVSPEAPESIEVEENPAEQPEEPAEAVVEPVIEPVDEPVIEPAGEPVEPVEPAVNEAAQRHAIDMDVLAELPPEIREEILANQQAIETAMNFDSVPGVNRDFLEGLPISMQAEVLQQARGPAASPSGISADMDMGTFLATLTDDLREEILLTMDESMLNALPPHFVAEVQNIRNRSRPARYGGFGRYANPPILGRPGTLEKPRTFTFRDYEGIPLLSESSLIPLLRILYLTDSTASAALPKLFHSICKHPVTRCQLLSFLLYILGSSKNSADEEPPLKEGDRFFSPLEFPCHSLIGFQEGKNLYSYSSTSGQYPPQTVIRRILYVVDFLAKKIPKIFEFMFEPMTYGDLSLLPEYSITSKDCSLPIGGLFTLLCQPQIVDSSQTLESFVNFIRLIFAPLHEFKVASDDGDDEIDPESSIIVEALEPERPENEVNEEPAEEKLGERSTKAEEPEDDILRICPTLPPHYLCNLPRVFTLKTCTEKTYKATMSILRRVCANEMNREFLLSELQNTAASLAQNLTEQLSEVVFEVSGGSLVVKQQSTGSPQGLSFLRLLKLMVALDSSSVKNDFDALWKHLDQSMNSATEVLNEQESTVITDSSSFSVLLPVIEAFFVVHGKGENEIDSVNPQNLNLSTDIAKPVFCTVSRTKSELASSTRGDSDSPVFQFVQRYKTILNLLIKQNPDLLSSGSFSGMIEFPFLLDFDVKRSYFRSKLHEGENHRYGGLRLNVRRDRLFEDSYHQLKGRTSEELKGRLTIQFANEPGIDAGGLLKDWYQELSRSIFNPGYALFIQSADSAFQPNKDSRVNAHHLDFFNFCGRVIGKAIYDGANMDVHFTRSFYKHILGKRVVWKDMEAVDPEYYKSLKWMLDNDVTAMELSFTAAVNSFGVGKEVDLIPGGSGIMVTEENKERYVQLMSEFKMTATIEEQIQAFLKGFYELVPKNYISLFNELELELLISGLPDIDIEDMRSNTEYTGYRADSPTIQYFWNIVKRYTQEERALLVQFVTGSSKVPLDGFEALQGMGGPQKFRIVKISGETDRLPSAHTCFNQLDMPEYTTEEELEHKLTMAIKETIGFGFG